MCEWWDKLSDAEREALIADAQAGRDAFEQQLNAMDLCKIAGDMPGFVMAHHAFREGVRKAVLEEIEAQNG